MSKRKEMIQLLDSISKFNTYSKYSNTLKKVFKNYSLKDLIKSLKHPIQADNFEFIYDFDKKAKKNDDENDLNFYPKGYLSKGKELDLFHDEYIPVEENKSKDKEKERSISKHTLLRNKSEKSFTYYNSILKRNEGLDPFKYNPNYNSIYKNIPSVKMISHRTIPLKKKEEKIKTFLTDIKSKKNKMKNLKKLNININIKINPNDDSHENKDTENENEKNPHEDKGINSEIENNNKNVLNINNNIKSRNSKTLPELKNLCFNSKNKKDKIKFSNNHAFRFSKYIPRKTNIYKVNNRLTYIEPHNYSLSDKNNKAIDFNKMEYRKMSNFISMEKLASPSFYYYNPKYESIEKNPISVIFNPKDLTSRNNKKFIIKKIWSMYNVRKEYVSIDNDKLK